MVVNSIKKNNNIDNFYIYPIPPPIGFFMVSTANIYLY